MRISKAQRRIEPMERRKIVGRQRGFLIKECSGGERGGDAAERGSRCGTCCGRSGSRARAVQQSRSVSRAGACGASRVCRCCRDVRRRSGIVIRDGRFGIVWIGVEPVLSVICVLRGQLALQVREAQSARRRLRSVDPFRPESVLDGVRSAVRRVQRCLRVEQPAGDPVPLRLGSARGRSARTVPVPDNGARGRRRVAPGIERGQSGHRGLRLSRVQSALAGALHAEVHRLRAGPHAFRVQMHIQVQVHRVTSEYYMHACMHACTHALFRHSTGRRVVTLVALCGRGPRGREGDAPRLFAAVGAANVLELLERVLFQSLLDFHLFLQDLHEPLQTVAGQQLRLPAFSLLLLHLAQLRVLLRYLYQLHR